MEQKTLSIILAVVAIALLIGSFVTYSMYANEKIDLSQANEALSAQENANDDLLSENLGLQSAIETIETEANAKDTQIEELVSNVEATQAEIDALNAQIAEMEAQAEAEAEEEVQASNRYTVDEFKLGETIDTIELTDRELSQLYDDEIEFNDEDIDVEEVFKVNGADITINAEDFAENVYTTLEEGDIEYKVTFEDTLDMSEISEDETLVFDFLGLEMEVTDWNGDDEITVSYGTEYFLTEGESITYGESTITIGNIYENDVMITVDDETEVVSEDDTEEFENLEVEVINVMDDDTNPMVKIKVGYELEEDIKSGDEFAEDSIWNWDISSRNIGLVLNAEFKDLDADNEDGEYAPLMPGGYISLPENYVTMFYEGASVEDMSEYSFEVDDGYLEIKGDFVSDNEGYDRVYVNATGIYDEDFNELSDVTLDESELEVSVKSATWFKINIPGYDNVVIALDMTDVKVGGTSGTSLEDFADDENELSITNFGIVVSDYETFNEDKELTLSIPEEAIEASLSFE